MVKNKGQGLKVPTTLPKLHYAGLCFLFIYLAIYCGAKRKLVTATSVIGLGTLKMPFFNRVRYSKSAQPKATGSVHGEKLRHYVQKRPPYW